MFVDVWCLSVFFWFLKLHSSVWGAEINNDATFFTFLRRSLGKFHTALWTFLACFSPFIQCFVSFCIDFFLKDEFGSLDLTCRSTLRMLTSDDRFRTGSNRVYRDQELIVSWPERWQMISPALIALDKDQVEVVSSVYILHNIYVYSMHLMIVYNSICVFCLGCSKGQMKP